MTLSELIATGEPFADRDAALAWLETTVPVLGHASANTLRAWAAQTGMRARFEAGCADTLDATASLALSTVDLLKSNEGMDLADPRVGPLLDSMEAATLSSDGQPLLSATARAALEAAATSQVKRWQHPDNQPLTHNGHVLTGMTLDWIALARTPA